MKESSTGTAAWRAQAARFGAVVTRCAVRAGTRRRTERLGACWCKRHSLLRLSSSLLVLFLTRPHRTPSALVCLSAAPSKIAAGEVGGALRPLALTNIRKPSSLSLDLLRHVAFHHASRSCAPSNTKALLRLVASALALRVVWRCESNLRRAPRTSKQATLAALRLIDQRTGCVACGTQRL